MIGLMSEIIDEVSFGRRDNQLHPCPADEAGMKKYKHSTSTSTVQVQVQAQVVLHMHLSRNEIMQTARCGVMYKFAHLN